MCIAQQFRNSYAISYAKLNRESIKIWNGAWMALFQELSRRGWKNCILETTGLNSRETFLREEREIAKKRLIDLGYEVSKQLGNTDRIL